MSNSNTKSLRKTKLGDLPEGRFWGRLVATERFYDVNGLK
jgi:hypothetical protein